MAVGTLQRIHLREVWKHEAIDFTQWLQQNLSALSEVLELKLVSAEREQSAGSFSVDLVAEDERGSNVIIENQLEKSNHDHLGKLITYLAAFNARVAIWIVSDPRPEHQAALIWLNQTALADFYLVKVEAVRIGDSQPAALFTLLVKPTAESRMVGKAKEEIVQGQFERRRFWTELMARSAGRSQLFAHKVLDDFDWMGIGAGLSGLSYNYVISKSAGGRVELYIDRGKGMAAENLRLFHELLSTKDHIERAFGTALNWQDLPGKQACRILFSVPSGGWSEPATWPDLQDQMIDAMVRLEGAFKSLIPTLRLLVREKS